MKTLSTYRTLGAIDARSVARDALLRWMALLTPLLGLLLRYGVPPIQEAIAARFGFDLSVYYPLLMSFLPIAVAAMVGTVIGFLLLDQRDDQTMFALLVTPLSMGAYLGYRLVVLMGACVVFAGIALLLADLVDVSALQVLVTSVTAAPLAPIYALFIGSVVSNKVQGFALLKALGIVVVPCIAAYFVVQPWQSLFGIVPHYWSLKTYWLFDEGAVASALTHALAGLVVQGIMVALLARRLGKVLKA
jgi:fluoroquinolone transport system permease protein